MWSEWLSSPGVAAALAGGALVLAGLAAVVLVSPVYKHILCLRYLFAGWKAVVPLVSALPAALGVFLLILVFAIMDGFVHDTREMTRGTLADIIVDAHMEGLPYYDDFLRRIDAVEGVESATPLIQTYAIIRVKPRFQAVEPIVRPCMIIGIRPAEKAEVGRFAQFLLRQTVPGMKADEKAHISTAQYLERLRAAGYPPEALLGVPPEFRRSGLPARPGCIAGNGLIGKACRALVTEKGYENVGSRVLLCFMAGVAFIIFLFVRQASRRNRGRRLWRVAMVAWALAAVALAAEAALIPVHEKRIERRQVIDSRQVDFGDDLLVSTIPIRPSGAMEREIGGMPRISEKIFALADVFKSGYWEADSSHLYVDFAVAQQMAGMEGQPATDDKPAVAARTSQIQVKVRDPAKAQEVVEKIVGAWREFVRERPEAGLLQLSVNTWETQQRMILKVVEMERNITALMLGLMFVGFAVLIALISYVMAYIKSRDVGILKAVGAHDAGVGSLFMGYGFIIGVIGTVLGLGGALLMIYYLDPLEIWVNTTFDINVFPREMYYFDHIPRHVSALWCVAVSGAVLLLATLASMAGGLLAALRQPVETLRYE
jgi:ABC-type lipoprotein release transport system permease subunit